MIFKFGFKEFKKNFAINLAVIIQMAIMLVIIIAIVTSVVSRFKYYAPYADYFEQEGNTMMVVSIRPGTSDDIKSEMLSVKDVKMSYKLSGGFVDFDAVVYDDELLERYSPTLCEGKMYISAPDEEYAQAIAPVNSGYKVGDIISNTPDEGVEPSYIRISGLFEDDEKLLRYNAMGTELQDYRFVYSEVYDGEQRKPSSIPQIYMARSEAEKTSGMLMPFGIGFVVFEDDISGEDSMANAAVYRRYGVQFNLENHIIEKNSKAYIYEQVYSLLPVIIGISILLLVSMFSANSVSTVRRLKNYAIYRVCGLTWHDCGKIAAAKAVFISLSSIILCGIFLVFKSKIPILKNYLIELGFWQIIAAVIVVALNLAISIFITNTILRKSEPNQLLKSN